VLSAQRDKFSQFDDAVSSFKEIRETDFAVVVHVERVLIRCAKCVVRSKLWQPEAWPDASGTAEIVEAMVKHANVTRQEFLAQAEAADAKRLYQIALFVPRVRSSKGI
jgi:hypothetical protein